MEQMAQLQPQVSKFLKLRVHHLSYFLINLWMNGSNPYRIEIKFNMENFVDTPSTKTTPRAVIFDDLTLQKMDNEITCFKKNEFIFRNNQSASHCINCTSDVQKFDSSFTILNENIDRILEVNKVIKKTKELKKKPNDIDKFQYRKLLKGYEREKSDAKRKIREVIVNLYS